MKTVYKFLVLLSIGVMLQQQIMPSNAHTIFVPRQLSYNPLYENALTKTNDTYEQNIFSIKPIYTQSVGNKLSRYFNIDHQKTLSVREDGLGDINSLWFNVQAYAGSMFSSHLAFCPIRKTYGGILQADIDLGCSTRLAIITALVTASNSMRIHETDIQNPGVNVGFANMTQAFANPTLMFGKICGNHTKTGLDDIQIKLLKKLYQNDCYTLDGYFLLGIPTGKGSKARFVLEPLVGSKHLQLGAGGYARTTLHEYNCGTLSLVGEAKWRYGLSGNECRSFDLKNNGQWSRYLSLVTQDSPYTRSPAINQLTMYVDTTPRNSVDLYLALHGTRNNLQFEIGYDFWYRQREKVCLRSGNNFSTVYGIADLPGIATLQATTASTATISQSTVGINQMKSDPTFVPLTLQDINLSSGAAPQAISNSFYGSLGYKGTVCEHPVQCGINLAYEQGHHTNTPNNIALWFNIDLYF